ncbi:restriction endonuclease subunit S [Streptomyces sp. NPDC019990]|uniref:restriction endonuclease subunit S n=1 Tax=Streptomyces sp. NPDC019990 TaxID=3154693 RepID=UPI0033FC8C9A
MSPDDQSSHGYSASQRRLGHFCEITAGPSGTLLDILHEGPSGVPVVSPPDLTEELAVDTRRLRRVPYEQAERFARFTLRAGDVLLVRQGTLGRLALIGEEHTGWIYSSSCLRLRPDRRRILPEFLAAYLAHPPVQRELLAQAQPGTVPSVNSTMLKEFPVDVPGLERQRVVVAALADIDEQIMVQRKMLNQLTALRPSVFEQLKRGE